MNPEDAEKIIAEARATILSKVADLADIVATQAVRVGDQIRKEIAKDE